MTRVHPIAEDQSFDLSCREATIQGVSIMTERVESVIVIGELGFVSMIEKSGGESESESESETERTGIENVTKSVEIENATGRNETKITTAAES